MIRQEATGCDGYPTPVVSLGRSLFNRDGVGGLLKQRESTDSAVELMIGKVSGDPMGFHLLKQQPTDHGNLPLAKLPDPLIAMQADRPEHDQLCKDE